MDLEPIAHPFTPSPRGTCIFPVQVSGDDFTFKPCGKMKSLHVTLVLNSHGEVVQGGHFVNAAHALGLPLLYETVE